MRINLISFAVVVFSLILFSCNSSITIAKKRYSNGYYVAISKDSKVLATEQKSPLSITQGEVESKEISVSKSSDSKNKTTLIKKKEHSAKTELSPKIVGLVTSKTESKKEKFLSTIALKNTPSTLPAKKDEMSDTFLLVLILTIIFPPLGVYLFMENSRRAMITLALLIGGTILGALIGISNVFLLIGYVLAWIYGLLYIFQKI